jgi:SAM-dependent methyltransferase
MKLDRAQNVNTGEYWDKRYVTIQHNKPALTSTDNFFRFGFLPKDKPVTVCEVGCGTFTQLPELLKRYPLVKWVGIDISDFATQFNKTNYGNVAEFHTLNIESEELPDTYDYIISAHTFEHLTDPMKATETCIKAARESVIIGVPYKESWSYDHEHMHTFSENEPYGVNGAPTPSLYVVEFEVVNKVGAIYFQFPGKGW